MIVIPNTLHISLKKNLISFATILGMDFTILRILFWGDANFYSFCTAKSWNHILGSKSG